MSELILDRFLPYRLNRASAAMSERHAKVYRSAHGLTVPAWRVMATLGALPEGGELIAREIGRATALHKTKVSRAVADLAERRWLTKRVDPADKRFEHLRLTELGRRAYRGLVPGMLAAERDLIERLGPDDAARLDQGLAALERLLGFSAGAEACDRDSSAGVDQPGIDAGDDRGDIG